MLSNISESRVDSFRYYYLSELDDLNLLSTIGGFLFSSIELAIEHIQANKDQELFVYIPYDVDKNKLYPNSTTVGRVFFKENIRIKKFGKIKINDNGFEWIYRNIINETFMDEYNNSEIKNIIFDLGGVLIKNRINSESILRKLKITEDELRKYLKLYYEIVYKNETWPYNVALKHYITAMAPYNADYEFVKTLFDFASGSKSLYDYTIPLIENLKSRGYNLYYLSNWTRSSYEICRMNGLFKFLDKYFEGGLFSFRENISKPNYRFFNKLLNRYSLSINNCILIDDQEANIDMANVIGVRSILFTQDIVNELMDSNSTILEQSSYSKGDDFRLHEKKDKVVNEVFDIGVDLEDDEMYDGRIYDPLKNTKKSSSEIEFELPDMESYKPDISTLFDNTPLDHIYLTSDWHFFKNHYKHEANYVNTQEILKWCKQNIKPEDVFVYLGDLSFRYANQEDQKKSQEFMSSIQGHKIFVLGNHDKMLGQDYFTKCGFDYVLEDFTWKNYIFTHKPVNMDTYPEDWWNIHGHIHNIRKYNTTDGKKNINVYPMFYDNKPVTMQYIIDHKEELVKDNEWNFNTGYGESAIDTKLKLLKEAYNTKGKPVVYYSSQVDSKIIAYMVSLFQDRLGDRIALKLHFGETGNQNFLNPNLLKDLVKYTNAALVDSNTAYEGSTRGTTQDHIRTAREHGFGEIGFIDILDADGGIDISIPKKYMIEQELRALANGKPGYESCITPGRHLSEINVGSHIKNYDSLIVYTHFKGHSVAGYGGAVKNIGMGIPTGSKGKMQIHGEDWARGPLFLERLVESASAIESMFDNRIVYVNVLQNLSTMCDCDKDAPKSNIPNIGVLVSTDILAIEQASLDFIRNAPGNKDLMEQISKLGGMHQIEYMKWLGMGSSNYTLKNVEDDKVIKLEFVNPIMRLFNTKKKVADYENSLGRINPMKNLNNHDSSIMSGDAIDVEIKSSIETFDIEQQKLLLESANIVEDYKNFINCNIDKNVLYAGENGQGPSYAQIFHTMKYLFINDDLNKNFLTNFYNISDDPEQIKQVIQARITYIQGLNEILKTMVKKNAKMLGLTSAEVEVLIQGLSNDKTNAETIGKIKDIIVKNKDKFIKNGGRVLDLRPIGAGVYVGSDADEDFLVKSDEKMKTIIQRLLSYDLEIETHGGVELSKDTENKYTKVYRGFKERFLKDLYEINTIELVSNGSNIKLDEDLIEDDLFDDCIGILKKYTKLNKITFDSIFCAMAQNTRIVRAIEYYVNRSDRDKINYKEICLFFYKAVNKYFSEFKKLTSEMPIDVFGGRIYLDANNSSFNSSRWDMAPIEFLNGKVYTDAVQLLKAAQMMGFTKIYFGACNPGHIKLPPSLAKNVTFGLTSNYKEDANDANYSGDIILEQEVIDSFKESVDALDIMEFKYRSVANQYGVDYDNITSISEYYSDIINIDLTTIDESSIVGDLFRKLIDLIIKAIKFVISLVKMFINAIKQLLMKIHSLITRRNQSTLKDSKVSVQFIEISGDDAKLSSSKKISNQKELEFYYNRTITTLVSAMNKNSDKQVRLQEELKKQCEDVVRRDSYAEAAFTIYKDDFKAEKQLYLSNFNKIKIDAKYIKEHPEIANELKRNDINYKSDVAYVWENKNNNIIAKLYIDNKDYKDGKKWIALIEITNGYRGAGLGKQVLEYAINVEKCTAIGVHKDNTVALNLYKQYGFKFYPKAEQDVKDGKNKYYLMYRGKLENPTLQAKGSSENISEGYIFNKDDIYYNKEKFEKGLTNVCFITGQSGSGKSTMGKKYNNKAVVVELDDIIWNKQFNTIEDFRNRFGPLVANFFTDSKYKKYFLTVDELRESKEFKHAHYEDALINDFVDYTLKYAAKHKDTKFVLEGVWIYLYIKPEIIKDYAVYIKGTSMVVSLYRACKRDGQPEFLDPGMWFEGESKLKKFRKYFVDKMLKDSTHESALITETKRSELPDSAFGIPEDRKFPLDTAQHVKSAIHLFGHAQEDKKKRLARRIKAAAKKYNITIPETTQCYKYLSEGALISIIPDNVNTIVFDMGNVLVDANTLDALLQNLDIPDEYCDEIKDFVNKECFYSDDRNIQAMDVAEIKAKLNESVPEHIKPYIDSILETFNRAMFIYPYAYEMLAMLRSKDYKLYYLSNWTKFSYELEESFFRPLLDKFDGGLFSFELGTIAKPDREMFEIFINRFSLDPSTCIFFDDRQENIDAAMAFGFNAYRFDKNDTPNIIFGRQIDIPENADDNILIADGDNGFKSVPLNTITWWYICENRYASNVDEECYYKTLEECIKFKLERLISTNTFTDNMLEIKEYVFTNSKAFSEIKTPPELVPVGIINMTESGAYEWEVQYPLRLENNILYSSFKENSLAAINPVIGLHKPFLIKVGDSKHPENLPSDHYVYTNDINNDKCLAIDDDGSIKLTEMGNLDVLEAYEFIGNPAYIDRLNRYYSKGTKVYNLYTALTDKLMLTEDQIEFDSNFKKIEFNIIEHKVMAEMVTLRDNIMDCLGFKSFRVPFIESAITKKPKFVNKYKDIISIKEDFDGNYFENNITKKRTISVSSSTMLTEDMLKAIL